MSGNPARVTAVQTLPALLDGIVDETPEGFAGCTVPAIRLTWAGLSL